MRSEKEIKKKILSFTKNLEEAKKGNVFSKCPDCGKYKIPIIGVGEANYIDRLSSIIHNLIWALEGEPRYSVSELEKIFQYLISLEKTDSYEWDVAYFIEFLKDTKKVEKILNG